MSRIAGRFARVEPRRRARRLVLGLLSDLPRKNCWTIAEWAGEATPGRHAAPARPGQVGSRPGTRRPARVRGGAPARRPGGAGGRRDRGREEGHRHGRRPAPVHRHRGQDRERSGRRLPGLHRPARARGSGPGTVRPALQYLRPRPPPRRRAWRGDSLRHQTGAGRPHGARFLEAGHQAAWVAGDEVYGGNPKLRDALEKRGTGYILAVAARTKSPPARGSAMRTRWPRRRPNGPGRSSPPGPEPRGHRFHDWAVIDLADPRPGSRQLLIRRNRSTGELACYRCYSPTPVPLTTLV